MRRWNEQDQVNASLKGQWVVDMGLGRVLGVLMGVSDLVDE